MNNKYNKWESFLFLNAHKCMPGTATEVASCLTQIAEEENFMPDNHSKEAKIRQLLPEHTPGVFKEGTDRELKSHSFIKIGKVYDLPVNHMQPIIKQPMVQKALDTSKQVKISKSTKGEKISIETPKDKSIDHNHLLNLIKEYADEHGIETEVEHKSGIDLLSLKDDKYSINEIKTYKNSIYVAVGQVQFYKHNLVNNFGFKAESIKDLNIVGNFELPAKFESFLKSLNINYINTKVSDIKEIF